MNQYCSQLLKFMDEKTISQENIEKYRNKVIIYLKDLGYEYVDDIFIPDETIYNGIKNYRTIEDIAWAILQ